VLWARKPADPGASVSLTISDVSQSGPNTAYSYTLISGAGLKVGESITVANMGNGGDNGTFTISNFGTDAKGNPTFVVTNPRGGTATSQSGVGTVPIACNPDLVGVKP